MKGETLQFLLEVQEVLANLIGYLFVRLSIQLIVLLILIFELECLGDD